MLLAGEIGKPHGLSGEVYVVRISDDPHRFDSGALLTHADGRRLVVESSRVHRDRLLVKFEGVASREDAAALKGALFVASVEARELEPDEFWLRDVEGAEVVNTAGEPVGIAVKILPGSAQDLLVVRSPEGEKLVPMVKEIVTEVDIEARRITIAPPPGLLD